MVHARCWLAVKNIVGTNAYPQKFLMKLAESFNVIVNTFEENRLVADIDAATEQIVDRLGG